MGTEHDARRSRPPAGVFTYAFLAIGVVLPFLTLASCEEAMSGYGSSAARDRAWWLFGASLAAAVALALFAIFGRARRAAVMALIVNLVGLAANVGYFVTHFSYTRGRQLRGPLGRVLPARSAQPLGNRRSRLARAWRNNGDTEAASVSAFSMLSLDLAELGAPLELVRAAHDDALDEIRHAELCYGIARRFGDEHAAIAAMPALAIARFRRCSLDRVAVDSWIEGAYLETVSAELARALAGVVNDPETREVLGTIAEDEARHASHAWLVVEWCLARDPTRVCKALGAALHQISAPDPANDEPGSDGELEPAGIPGRDLQRRIAERCLTAAKARLVAMLRPS